ncbi:cellulose biosynthesis protein BcsF [Pseudomonas sp. RGM2987]|uniref:cellulose biosynthesis protein BcsF n=1 Tax=Pseudomonas sp. RGM2987 TaxID=2930090 RepID=UPI001FD671D5|nr:cellulose biosynthesis protein BcsF [Pseudomonas sp. RGM2987]MCJ8207948.1 cellulose biosynthesis protein BcsF [Pseudomonas sp. RGM2987]
MSYYELLQVIAASCLLTFALIQLLRIFWRQGRAWVQGLLPPRYLKPHRVPRDSVKGQSAGAPHE